MKKIKRYFLPICDLKLNIPERILLLAPIMVWFSYQPNFHIGRSEGMNIEFSLVMIYIVTLAISGLFEVYKNRQKLAKNRAVWLTFGFLVWNAIGILWGVNKPRAFLTTGILGVLFLDLLTILSVRVKELAPVIIKTYIYMAVVMSILAILQVAYGAWYDYGLCNGCLARGFGFVRPSGFTIEPQFLGSLLIAPIVLLVDRFIAKKSTKLDFFNLFIMLVAMYLTLSRGAIFSLIIALIFLVLLRSKNFKQAASFGILFLMNILISSFLTGMVIHGVFTQLNPRVSDGFYDSISKSVNQMSLGTIKLPNIDEESASIDETEENVKESTSSTEPQKAMFDGYVERSTEERTNMSSLAIRTWQKDLTTVLFGVGPGGSGRAIYNYTNETGWEFEIVQNQYIETLLENGLVGAILFGLILGGFFVKTRSNKIAWAILIAFMVQWNFFSGLPNALHIYLILAIAFGIIVRAYEKRPSIN